MGERLTDIARGVEHVGRIDDVDGPGAEALRLDVLFDVQDCELHEGTAASEAGFAEVREPGGDVGVMELDRGRERRDFFQDTDGGAAGACTDLENADRASALGQDGFDGGANGRCDLAVEVFGDAGTAINGFDGLHVAAGEKGFGSREVAAKNFGVAVHAAAKQLDRKSTRLNSSHV